VRTGLAGKRCVHVGHWVGVFTRSSRDGLGPSACASAGTVSVPRELVVAAVDSGRRLTRHKGQVELSESHWSMHAMWK